MKRQAARKTEVKVESAQVEINTAQGEVSTNKMVPIAQTGWEFLQINNEKVLQGESCEWAKKVILWVCCPLVRTDVRMGTRGNPPCLRWLLTVATYRKIYWGLC